MDPRAGQPAESHDLIDVEEVLAAYAERVPDVSDPGQRVVFGTSGHRGSSLDTAFNDAHIAAISQAIAEHRADQGVDGPLLIGADSHALSAPALQTAIEVLVAAGVDVRIDADDRLVPTPAVSHGILTLNQGDGPRADGIVVTPSHNPPRDGGFKYNPPHGGPADSDVTTAIANRANELIAGGLTEVGRVSTDEARSKVGRFDFLGSYVADLATAIDLEAIRRAGIRIGADPLGGASVDYWGAIGDSYSLDLTVVNPTVDPTFAFMTLDHDGKIRMDCSSPYAMASLVAQRDAYDIATGNDADADRHGIVTPDAGLMNPNHYLAVAIDYLFTHRHWGGDVAVGKTLVSSSLIDRIVAGMGRRLWEVPVGFKWFVPGLIDGSVGFGGEESAGASFLRDDASVWTTDKDGILLALLAAEILAVTGESPSQHHRRLADTYGNSAYTRVDAPATREEKSRLGALSPAAVTATELAGEAITGKLTTAPGNDAAIGGLKVITDSAWFAARPSGTEDVYKIYAESFKGEDHLQQVLESARDVVAAALAG